MPIRSHLNGQRFDAETIRVMGLAYELTLISLRLVDRGDIANDVVAKKIIELVKTGERDPERLCKAVVRQWGRPIAHVAPSDQIWSSVWAILTRQICGPKISSFNGGRRQATKTSQARTAWLAEELSDQYSTQALKTLAGTLLKEAESLEQAQPDFQRQDHTPSPEED